MDDDALYDGLDLQVDQLRDEVRRAVARLDAITTIRACAYELVEHRPFLDVADLLHAAELHSHELASRLDNAIRIYEGRPLD